MLQICYICNILKNFLLSTGDKFDNFDKNMLEYNCERERNRPKGAVSSTPPIG